MQGEEEALSAILLLCVISLLVCGFKRRSPRSAVCLVVVVFFRFVLFCSIFCMLASLCSSSGITITGLEEEREKIAMEGGRKTARARVRARQGRARRV